MLCAVADDPNRGQQYGEFMTVVDDNYTGHVETRTAARRTLPNFEAQVLLSGRRAA